ncbi:hypothetical protein SDC9_177715 [bioreactor metagenome]|uniref:Uncharacterized protein n=1 Tax=bioreactor metagenome TaxID=1076179 RepID=A0A645GW38_9ZZZZ|nr:hypothetical protein [Pseudomonas aeruginosa]
MNITTVQGELDANAARKLTMKARTEAIEAAAVPFMETAFRDIKTAASMGRGALRYEETALDPKIIALVLKYLRVCGFKVQDIHGVNVHRLAAGDTLIGGTIQWAEDALTIGAQHGNA